MSLEINGTLLKVMPEQSGMGKNGNWVKQDFIVETQEQYPKKICCTAWGDKVEELKKYKDGDGVKISINIESREYNGKWYTDIKAWRIDKAGSNPNTGAKAEAYDDVPPPTAPPAFIEGQDDGDLPF
jgi:hypothetical protein